MAGQQQPRRCLPAAHLRYQSIVLGLMLTWPHAGPASWWCTQVEKFPGQDSWRAKAAQSFTKQQLIHSLLDLPFTQS